MQNTITSLLKDIEQKHNVTVIYACETGSRAWGFPSPDSDYDVRMIYKHNMDKYLALGEPKDTIEYMSPDGELDVTGWDIKKCLHLMWRSNGALLERVQSPIIYRDVNGVGAELQEHAWRCYSPIATMHHYLGMAKKSFADAEGMEDVKLKKLFYALRATLACKWILNRDTPPPIVFAEMVDSLQFDETLKSRIRELVTLKAGKSESYMHPAEYALNTFIASEIAAATDAAGSLPGRKDKNVPLDEFFRKIVKGVDH